MLEDLVELEIDLVNQIEYDIEEYKVNNSWEFDFEEYEKYIETNKAIEQVAIVAQNQAATAEKLTQLVLSFKI